MSDFSVLPGGQGSEGRRYEPAPVASGKQRAGQAETSLAQDS